MKVIPLKQFDDEACGPTCIKMVSEYFDLPISIDEIIKISQYRKHKGLSNEQLVNVLEKIGFQVKIKINCSWNRLLKENIRKTVIIVSWMLNGYISHFSVVDFVNENYIFLADPYSGKIIKMRKIEFMRLWLDYDGLWFPLKNSDIQLRWMALVSKK